MPGSPLILSSHHDLSDSGEGSRGHFRRVRHRDAAKVMMNDAQLSRGQEGWAD